MADQVAFCTDCKTYWPLTAKTVREANVEADRWLRTHPCPANPKEKSRG